MDGDVGNGGVRVNDCGDFLALRLEQGSSLLDSEHQGTESLSEGIEDVMSQKPEVGCRGIAGRELRESAAGDSR